MDDRILHGLSRSKVELRFVIQRGYNYNYFSFGIFFLVFWRLSLFPCILKKKSEI